MSLGHQLQLQFLTLDNSLKSKTHLCLPFVCIFYLKATVVAAIMATFLFQKQIIILYSIIFDSYQ